MALKEESQNLTAFIAPKGLYKKKRLPMGLVFTPGAFQNLMELILSGLSYEVALVYPDDIIVFGKKFQEHPERLELVFGRLGKSGLKIEGSKRKFVSKNKTFFAPCHIGERSGSGPKESESSREDEKTHQFKGNEGSPGISRVL